MSTNKKDDFINILTNETFENPLQGRASDSNIEDLHSYFLEKEKRFLEKESKTKLRSEVLKLSFMKDISCYRTEINGQVIDIPKNWSIFSKIDMDLFNGQVPLNDETDPDFLAEVLSQLFDYTGVFSLSVKGKDIHLIYKEYQAEIYNQAA